MSVYFAHPIDQAGAHPDKKELASSVFFKLVERGFLVYDPEAAFTSQTGLKMTASTAQYIRGVNRTALENASVVVAVLPAGVPTVGVMIEIGIARDLCIPTVVVTDLDPARITYLDDLGVYTSDPDDAVDLAVEAMALSATTNLVFHNIKMDLPVRLDQGAQMPTQGYSDDAGFDLYVTKDTTIPAPPRPGDAQAHQNPAFVDVPCGVRVQLPHGTWALITGRSSTIRNRGLLVVNSIIDAGYRGEYFAACQNMTTHPVQVKAGERIAQFIILPALAAQYRPVEVAELAPSERGAAGFGSSGV